MSVGQRIRKLIKQDDLTQEAFSTKVGITRQTVNNAIKGKNLPSGDVLNKIAEAYPYLNMRWLLTGEGTMFMLSNESDIEINNYGSNNSFDKMAGGDLIALEENNFQMQYENNTLRIKLESLRKEMASKDKIIALQEELINTLRK